MLWCLVQCSSSALFLFLLVQLVRLIFSDCDLVLSLYARRRKKLANLRGKVCWITGASSGIGEELAYCLAELGAKLILSARREAELERVLEKCKALSPEEFKNAHMVLQLDLLDYEKHGALTEEVVKQYGRIDYLVNNAGRSQRSEAVLTQLEVDRALLDLNTVGTISLTKAVLPHLIQQGGGSIVVMSSVAGKLGAPGSASYSASKHALQGFFNTLRMEIADKNIKVVMICPGPVVSKILGTLFTTHLGKKHDFDHSADDVNRMPTERCAYLSAVAMANNLSEVWISPHPILLFTYIVQYLPTIGTWLGNVVGNRRLKAIREGKANVDASFFKRD